MKFLLTVFTRCHKSPSGTGPRGLVCRAFMAALLLLGLLGFSQSAHANRTINSATLNNASSVTVVAGDFVTLVVNVTTDSSGGGNPTRWRGTGWLISATPPGTLTCWDNTNYDSAGTNSANTTIQVPATAGTYNLYLVAYSNNGCSSDASTTYVLTGGVIVVKPPTATTGAASSITGTSATLNGTVSSNGASTTVTFDFGLTSGYGTPLTATPSSLAANAVNTAVSAAVTGLTCNTTYHFLVKGVSTNGTGTGSDGTFTTSACLPSVTTTAASAISTAGATLNGTVSSNGASTTVTFNYGTSTSYGSIATASASPLAAGATNSAVSSALTGLTCGTTYHFQASGTNTAGTKTGSDQSFSTSACPVPSVTSINRVDFNPARAGYAVSWTVLFNTPVTGVDATDFALIQTAGASGASISSVTGSGTTYTVTANTGSAGTLGLNLVDNDSIVSGSTALGGAGLVNGNFTGQTYTLVATVCTGAADILFCDDFERSNPGSVGNGWTVTPANAGNCTGTSGNAGCAGIDSDIPPFNTYSNPRPNPTRAMFTRWNVVSVDSKIIDLSATTGAQLSFWIRRGRDTFSECPEASGENYLVQYYASNLTWKTLAQYPSSPTAALCDGQIFTPTIELPPDALHNKFQMRFYQPSGSGQSGSGGAAGVVGYDYWHMDDVVIRKVTSPSYVGAFCDNFEAGLSRWSISAENYSSGNIGDASIGTLANLSPTHELDMRWGYVTASTFKTNLTGVSGNITFWVKSGAGTLDPATNEDLVVEYLNSSGVWTTLKTYLGTLAAGTVDSFSVALPADAKHAGFRLRFRKVAGSGYDKSYWHIDDVCVGNAVANTDMALTKTGDTTLIPGTNTTYTLKATNGGPDAMSGALQVIDTLPNGLTYVSGSGSGWTCSTNAQVVTCNWPGTLANGALAPDLVISASVGAGVTGSVTNTAVLTSTGNDPTLGNNTASFTSGNFIPYFIFTNSACVDGIAIGQPGQSCGLVTWTSMVAGQSKTGIYITAVNASGVPTKLSSSASTTVSTQFGLTCHDPIANAGVQATFTATAAALPLCTGNGADPTSWSTATSLTFLSGAPSVATSYTFTYADVGEVELFMRNSVATTQVGKSGHFVVKPAGFVLSAIKCTTYAAGSCATAAIASPGNNPGASTATGTAFIQAGQPFSVTVTAVNTSNVATPNFGKEQTPEGVQLDAALVLPSGGNAAALNNPTAFGNFVAGVATGTTFNWPEVGIITLAPSLADGDYLGAGDVIGTTSGNVGRFIPDHFGVTGSLVNRSDLAAPGGTFTYMGEPMKLNLTVTAYNQAEGPTQNYTGSFAKLDAATLGSTDLTKWICTIGTQCMGLAAIKGSTALTSRLVIDTAAANNSAAPSNKTTFGGATDGWSVGVSYFTLYSVFSRLATPDGPYGDGSTSFLTIGVKPLDSDGVSLPRRTSLDTGHCSNLDITTGTQDSACNPGSTEVNLRRKLVDTTVRFGKLRLIPGQGSELAVFKMQAEVQYWDGTYWRTNKDDSLTSFASSNFAISGTTGATAGTATGINQGFGSILLNKPSSAGTATVCMDMATTSNGCTGASAANLGYLLGGSTYDKDPSATVLFGGANSNSRGNWGFLYRRENF